MFGLFLLLTQNVFAGLNDKEPEAIKDREYMMETNIRFRQLGMPDSLMDNWFYGADDPGANPYERPSISAYVIGMEFVIKPRPMNWVIYFEYLGSNLTEGYWDDVETGVTPDHEDGDWVRPDNFSGWFLGANYGYEVPITPEIKGVWLSLVTGGGLGIGYIAGDLAFWHPGSNAITDTSCLPEAPAYLRKNECEPDGIKSFPRVLPMVDLSLGIRVNLSDRANIRFEGGLHNFLYYGTAFGGVF